MMCKDKSQCENCGNIYEDEANLKEIEHLTERVDPGEIMPVGECPGCGALCHYIQPAHWDEDPDHSVKDWKEEVLNDDTRQSYREWVTSQRELHKEEKRDTNQLSDGPQQPIIFYEQEVFRGRCIGCGLVGDWAYGQIECPHCEKVTGFEPIK